MRSAIVFCCAIALPLAAKDKKPKPQPQDSIEVVAKLPLTAGPVRKFLVTDHFSSHYLYAEHNPGGSLTLVDVTRPDNPLVLAEVPYPQASSGNVMAVSGTAALVTTGSTAPAPAPETVRVLDFSDPRNPKLVREFVGVTAIERDERRSLIFLANAEGIWILHQSRAVDPEVEKAYAHHVLYDH